MSEKRLYGIRGATCTENTPESIIKNVGELCRALFLTNKLETSDIVSVQFTVTPDIDAMNPATALRKAGDVGLDTSVIPLFCSQEPVTKGMPKSVIRTMVTAYMEQGAKPVGAYVNGAQILRPDLASKHPTDGAK
ncbi:MAG: chorismate mutase [Treponema sp.]|nr:chorismate mutase [Treponema sp.]